LLLWHQLLPLLLPLLLYQDCWQLQLSLKVMPCLGHVLLTPAK
jgi:hypothetical protein